MLEVVEGHLRCGRPPERQGGEGEGGEWGCDAAVAPDEAPIKIGKAQESLQLLTTGGG